MGDIFMRSEHVHISSNQTGQGRDSTQGLGPQGFPTGQDQPERPPEKINPNAMYQINFGSPMIIFSTYIFYLGVTTCVEFTNMYSLLSKSEPEIYSLILTASILFIVVAILLFPQGLFLCNYNIRDVTSDPGYTVGPDGRLKLNPATESERKREKKVMDIIYPITIFCFTFLVIAFLITTVCYFLIDDIIKHQLTKQISQAGFEIKKDTFYESSSPNSDLQSLNQLQQTYKCCGLENFKDWAVYNNFTNFDVPTSCCKNVEFCGETKGDVVILPADQYLSDNTQRIYVEGCYEKITISVQTNLLWICLPGLCLSLIMMKLLGDIDVARTWGV